MFFARTQRVYSHAKRVFICARSAQKQFRTHRSIFRPPWPNFATFFVPNTQLSKKKRESRGAKWVWYNFLTFLQIYVWYFSSMGIQTLMFLCYFFIQVQSYNLKWEHYRRKVALEIRNKEGMLSNLGFLEQERTRNILCE